MWAAPLAMVKVGLMVDEKVVLMADLKAAMKVVTD